MCGLNANNVVLRVRPRFLFWLDDILIENIKKMKKYKKSYQDQYDVKLQKS